jgi:molybdopterin molybdotransferase
MLSYAEALEAIQALDHVIADERIPLDQAQGRVLAEDIRLSADQPPFDRATMDGFAVVLHGTRADFIVQGLVPAGSTFTGILQPGDAVRIMTGAPVPAGTTVIPLEATDQADKPLQGKGLTHKTMSASLRVMVTDTNLLMPGRNIARRACRSSLPAPS